MTSMPSRDTRTARTTAPPINNSTRDNLVIWNLRRPDGPWADQSMPPIKRTKFKLTPEQLLEMFYWLKLIRAFDERLSVLVKQGKVRSGVYTGIGQEAIVVGTCFGLRRDDFICPLHRDLGAFLMKGVDARAMMAQMFAKASGLSKGR